MLGWVVESRRTSDELPRRRKNEHARLRPDRRLPTRGLKHYAPPGAAETPEGSLRRALWGRARAEGRR